MSKTARIAKTTLKDLERRKKIIGIAVVGVIVNLTLAVAKMIIGQRTGSVAIVTDGVSNVADSLFSFITIVGIILTYKQPNKKHPFGYGRVEYLTSFFIGVLVLATGFEAFKRSLFDTVNPVKEHYTWDIVGVLIATIAVKVFFAMYAKRQGVVLDCRPIKFLGIHEIHIAKTTIISIFSVIGYIKFNWHLSGYAGMLISIIVMTIGFHVLKDIMTKLLGERVDPYISADIYKRILSKSEIIDAHDLIINNYGQNKQLGSISVELDKNMTAGKIYPVLHRLQVEIYNEYRIMLVFGIYAVDLESDMSVEIWKLLSEFRKSEPTCVSCHGVLVDDENEEIYCNVTVDFGTNTVKIKDHLYSDIKEKYPNYEIFITVDYEFA